MLRSWKLCMWWREKKSGWRRKKLWWPKKKLCDRSRWKDWEDVEDSRDGSIRFMFSGCLIDLCHDRCACMAGQKSLIKILFFCFIGGRWYGGFIYLLFTPALPPSWCPCVLFLSFAFLLLELLFQKCNNISQRPIRYTSTAFEIGQAGTRNCLRDGILKRYNPLEHIILLFGTSRS